MCHFTDPHLQAHFLQSMLCVGADVFVQKCIVTGIGMGIVVAAVAGCCYLRNDIKGFCKSSYYHKSLFLNYYSVNNKYELCGERAKKKQKNV